MVIKRALLFSLAFILIINLSDADSVTGKIVTGEIVTGEATSRDVNVTLTIGDNSAPTLDNVPNNHFICEGEAFSFNVRASDINEDNLVIDMNPKSPFFISSSSRYNSTTFVANVFSGVLGKTAVGGKHSGNKTYLEVFSVTDGLLADSKQSNITVIEINNAPVIGSISDQTVSLNTNPLFYLEVGVTDEEDGNQNSENITFNITFLSGEKIFNISQNGIINTTLDSSHIGIYNISVCVSDAGIANPFVNISSECDQDGSNRSDCEGFLLNVSQQATIAQEDSGGGGGGTPSCSKKWGCQNWDTCINVAQSLEQGLISGSIYRDLSLRCEELSYTSNDCGFHKRSCVDVNECDSMNLEKTELQVCYYSPLPGCNDGIKNCHDGSCEILVDCGGPCQACATCSDGIQNQREEGVDCGGPCPNLCPFFYEPPGREEFARGAFFLTVLVLLILVFYLSLRRFQRTAESEEEKLKEE